ncbi:MAG: sugar-binding domain-containing protein [Acholeplasmataceae bacterium]
MKQLYTPWGQELDKTNVLSEYPRPQMKRDSYLNLNGYWDYAIYKNEITSNFDGKILVPFSPESVLSGVSQFVTPDDYLHYHRTVVLPNDFLKERIILHFGAIDQEAKIYINNQFVIHHLGGFISFQIDITDYIKGNEFDIYIIVRDITDTSYRQTGKQRIKRGGIFYTPQSGIWQTVWLESVLKEYIKDYTITIDYDTSKVFFKLVTNHEIKDLIKIKIFFKDKLILEQEFNDFSFSIYLEDKKSWTPDNPNLYDFEIIYKQDIVKGYFGMRKFERVLDEFNKMRFYLNNEPYFLSGVLDQGYYPDGLLTPPSDMAMIYDIQTMKDLGFNLLRKHIKIEPLRWYYHCDRIGMIVWQDMINGSARKDMIFHGGLALANIHLSDKNYCLFGRKSIEGRKQYQIELDEMLNHLKNVTSIATWVPFNEAWGQFDSLSIAKHVLKTDSTRLIDHASGWSDQKGGDYYSRHIYFKKIKFSQKNAKKRILALTEFGGYSLMLQEHSYHPEKVFGYKKFDTIQSLEDAVCHLYETEVLPEIDKGLSVLIYTQLSDVEDEVNGLLTYDRKILKIDADKLIDINKKLNQRFNNLYIKKLE